MEFTVNDRVLPAYYRDAYYGDYKPIYASKHRVLKPNVITALHYHDFIEFGICQCGSGVTHVDNRIYNFIEGDLQVVPAGVAHLSAAEPEVDTQWLWISVDAAAVLKNGGIEQPDSLLQLCAAGFAGVFHPWEHPWLAELLYKFRNTLEKPDDYSQTEYALLLGQMLLECARIGVETKMESVNMGYSGKLKPAMVYIRENFADKEAMREDRIAQSCRMSTSYFRAVFKKETGQSVRSFVIQTRLARAAYLLKTTDINVMHIAMEAGFGQVSCFNRMFYKTFSQSPTAFRKQYRNP